MPPNNRPDGEARLVSHLVVGCAAGALLGKRSGLAGFLVVALLTAMAHEALDAPVAQVLSEFGF